MRLISFVIPPAILQLGVLLDRPLFHHLATCITWSLMLFSLCEWLVLIFWVPFTNTLEQNRKLYMNKDNLPSFGYIVIMTLLLGLFAWQAYPIEHKIVVYAMLIYVPLFIFFRLIWDVVLVRRLPR